MTREPVLMGIDIGTSASRGILATLEGEVIAEHTTPHGFDIPHPGWAEHDADEVWWHDFCLISRALLQQSGLRPEQIAGVGCSAIAPTMLPLDKKGQPLRPSILYGIDTRASAEIEELSRAIGDEHIYERCGQFLSSQSVGPKVLWFKRNQPELYRRTHKVVTACTYLVYRLTGQFVLDNYVAPYFAPFFDVNKLSWDQELVEPICPLEWLPTTQWATEVAGVVTPQASQETGLAVGTPVATGTADAAAEAISAGATQPGDLMVMYGTTMFLIQALDRFKQHPKLWASVYCIPGQSALAAGMSTSGALLRWFKDELGQTAQALDTSTFEMLAQEAACVPSGSEGLITLPYFSGERTPINDPHARGLFFGLTLKHTRAHLYRSCMEGIAYGLRQNLEAMASIGASPRRVVAVGGGTKDPLWLQICSDVTGMPQEVPEQTLGAAYGDAYLAGCAAGLFKDSTPLRKWVKISRTVKPDPAKKPLYDQLYGLYCELYANTRELMHRVARLGVDG